MSIRAVAVAVAALALSTSDAAAQSVVNLIAAPLTKTVSLPDGTSVTVPMWGFAPDDGDGVLEPGETPTVPGPRITVPAGGSLTINLRNLLPNPVSIVIPGQQPTAVSPVRRDDGRIVSIVPEAAPGGVASYTWSNLRAGTYLYHSGSHPAVQVQMGLYGAVTPSDPAAGQAYPGVAYDNEVLLLFSEIDIALHQAVNNGTYGNANAGGPTSTVDYAPSLFLVNGDSYTGASAALPAGAVGQRTLLRMLNAGLRSHVVVVDNTSLALLAEDGNPYRDARNQASVLLPAGKTHDAIWMAIAAGDYAVYDRTLHLVAGRHPLAGMLAKLRVGAAIGGSPPVVQAVADAYALPEDPPGPVGFSSVLANDLVAEGHIGALTAELFALPRAGALTFNPDGAFSYRPPPDFSGVDSFSYRAVYSGNRSAPAEVILTVAPVQDVPTAFPLELGLTAGEAKPITFSGIDPDGDPLTFNVTQLPTDGTLSIVDPVTAIRRNLVPADLNVTIIPGGTLIYTPNGPFVGLSTFKFRAADGFGFSTPATVTVTVYPAEENAATEGAPLALNVVGSDGAAIAAYRWTLEEDLTLEVQPGVLDPNALSVSFHRSYMPVVASGDESTPPRIDPTRRYFVSVLPRSTGYTNGGAPIARGQTSIRVTVNATPIPTAQLTVQVFVDNGTLNGVRQNSEPGLEGFAVKLADAGGQKGHAAAHQIMDAFGNPLGTTYRPCTDPAGCTSYEVNQAGDGFLLTDANGLATFKNLSPGLYEVFVTPPAGTNWVQGIQTIEGGKPVEAWVKPNEPPFFSEFGPPGPHITIGFVQPTLDRTFLGAGPGPFSTITGQVTNMRQSRPPAFTFFSGAPFDFTQPYVALLTGPRLAEFEAGNLVYLQPTDEEGNFSIAGVPSGAYKLVVFDSAANFIPATRSLIVNAPDATELGDVAVFQWFGRMYHYVFDDLNQNGFRDAGERGIPEQNINLRWRDASIYQSYPTDVNGFVPFEQHFPFFNWLIAEVDYARFKATGVTVVVDGGGNTNVNTTWPEQVGAELDSGVLAPQPQSENGNAASRTETGPLPVLLEGYQVFLGQSNVLLWGKAPYAVPGSVPLDVNVVPFDDFPGPGDTDGNTNGKFDYDVYHGGITGIVHYATTRAENLARWGTPEFWEPGIPGVRVQLWDATRTRLLNEATADSWDDSQPTGCQGEVFTYLGRATDCYDGLRNWNQVRPGVFDGGFAFYTQLEPLVDASGGIVPIDQRTIERPLPAGKYVVKVIVPNGYQLVKEEDKNVDFGEEYIPQEFLLTGYPLGDDGPPDPAARPREDNDNVITPFCVGALHTVPDELSLFPGLPGTYAGDQIPLCDEKLVVLRNGQNATGNFYLFTEAPVAGHVVGFVLDDTANEFDPNAPQFGEKFAPPWMAISIRDFTGREITRTYSDRNGAYNALVPSTFTSDRPAPSGYAPNMLQVCVNSHLMPGPNGTLVPDPNHNKNYSQFCYPFQYMPGKTTYMDTPVLPTGAFAGQPGLTTLDAELPDFTPVIYSVNGPGNIGPYVVPQAGDAETRTITIRSAGTVRVPNPAFDWITTRIPKEITRDYGFGAITGQVLVGTGTDSVALPILSWSNTFITAEVPVGTPTGQLRVIRCLAAPCTRAATRRESVLAVTLTVATPAFHAARPPRTMPAGTTIQAAIDAAQSGDLILVPPGNYEELVIMDKPVRLQGWGARSTTINAIKAPTEKLQAWRDRLVAQFAARMPATPSLDVGPPTVGSYLLPFQQTVLALVLGAPPEVGFELGDILGQLGINDDALGDLTREVLGIILRGEGAGVSVFGRYLPAEPVPPTPDPDLGPAPAPPPACRLTARTDGGFGLQTESGQLRPNARIDGFTITGSDQAAGIEVNAHACDLVISNNHIHNNSGYHAGGVKIGQPGTHGPAAETAYNDRVTIAHNHINQNAGNLHENYGIDANGGGGIAIGDGATGYRVVHNFVAGNFTGGEGAGIAHMGQSIGGTIDHNTVIFNESFNQLLPRSGGGIVVRGPMHDSDPADFVPGPLPGAGDVTISNNLILGNQAASGDGGGISIFRLNGVEAGGVIPPDNPDVGDPPPPPSAAPVRIYRANIFGNTIVNNVAGLAGGGIALQDAIDVRIFHNTIAHNDSIAVAEGAFVPRAGVADPFISTPQPAGIVSRRHSPDLIALLGPGQPPYSNPQIVNSIVWQNRSYFFGPVPGGVEIPQGQPVPTYGLIPRAVSPYWDLGVVGGGPGAGLEPTFSVLTSPTGATNVGTPPAFVSAYFNGSRQPAIQFPELTTIQAPPAFDEGGNFIRPLFGPLTLTNPATGLAYGDYHLISGIPGQWLSDVGGVFPDFASIPVPLRRDRDGDWRLDPISPRAFEPHRGADQVGAAPAQDPTTTTPGLVAAFGFDEVSGATVFDASPAGNDGSFNATNGPTRTTEGRFGGALVFDGTDDLVRIADSNSLDISRMTVSAWVKPSAPDGWCSVIMKERPATDLAYGLWASSGTDGPATYICAGCASPFDQSATSAATLPVDEWHYLAATYDGTVLRLYVNGAEVKSFAVSGSLSSSGSPLFIGGNEVWGERFSGVIDEVRVYNRALTAAEIQADMNRSAGSVPPTP